MAQLPTTPGLQTDTFPAGNTASPMSKGLSIDAKKRLGISAAALLLGGGAALAFMPRNHDEPLAETPDVPDESAPVTLPSKADEAVGVNDTMSFDTAFATARDEVGLGGVFMWRNQAFNTFLREEWAGLSLQQRQEYAEHVLDAKLPIAVQQPAPRTAGQIATPTPAQPVDPTIIEGQIGDRRVMGIDQDNDGVIDVLVIEGEDGYTYRVADASGNQGLDTIYMYDAVKDEYVAAVKLDEPIMLTNDDFNAQLEDAMSKEAVDAIMAEYPEDAADVPVLSEGNADENVPEAEGSDATNEDTFEVDGYGDTYVNNANVGEMDEPHQ